MAAAVLGISLRTLYNRLDAYKEASAAREADRPGTGPSEGESQPEVMVPDSPPSDGIEQPPIG